MIFNFTSRINDVICLKIASTKVSIKLNEHDLKAFQIDIYSFVLLNITQISTNLLNWFLLTLV